ncbi:hypothetical protein [uncultured Brevundimonas sp.]|uniref:hypothetical protein n=1 Tax=uncultured Brevundimonas sp. TaxID=213418 RepID=UPI0030EDE689
MIPDWNKLLAWGNLLSTTWFGRKVATPDETEGAARRRPALPSIDPRLDERLSSIEQAALAIYHAHGLPVRAGDYRRGPRGKRWTFIGDDLGPEERWAAIVERPPESGWRHARLEDIGGYETRTPLVEASRLLVRCRWIRGRLYGLLPGDPAQDLLAAIELGAAWRTVAPVAPEISKPAPARRKPRAAPASAPARRGPRSGS